MKDLILLAIMMTGLNADLIEAKEIKRTIIVRQINGKTEVFGLEDSPDAKTTIRRDKDGSNVTITVDRKQTNPSGAASAKPDTTKAKQKA